MGGMGKTTLAKMATTTVIRDYARAWVTVGREFDLKKIGNCILSQLSNKGEHQDSSDVELIMKRLHELLLHGGGGNKLLVVLDDLWPDDSSDLMGCPQAHAGFREGRPQGDCHGNHAQPKSRKGTMCGYYSPRGSPQCCGLLASAGAKTWLCN